MNIHKTKEINSQLLMPLQEYNAIWADIRQQAGSLKQNEFWMIVENIVNEELKTLFMSSEPNFPYLIGYDDDKVHFDYSLITKMHGLSQQFHACDNHKGLTLHTCAYSAICVPVAVHFQREGESVQETYSRSMKSTFGTGVGGLPNVQGVTLASDRGYWKKGLLFGTMLEAGADIVGTVKRVSSIFVMCVCDNCFCPSFFLPIENIFFCRPFFPSSFFQITDCCVYFLLPIYISSLSLC